MEIQINEELKSLLDPLTEKERETLEASIKAEGQRDDIIVWKEGGMVVDGHNRLEVIRKLGLVPKVKEMSFPSIEAVKIWMMQNQLGRRNLTKERFHYFIGQLYNATKQSHGGKIKPQDEKKTAEIIGEKHGIAERTVRRAGDFAKGIDRVGSAKGPEVKEKILSGKGNLNQAELEVIGKTPNAAVASRVIERLTKAKEEKREVAKANKEAEKSEKAHDIALLAPDFDDSRYSHASVVKPPLKKDCGVYIRCADEYLADAIGLLKAWGLDYECSFIFHGPNKYDGVFSKVSHEFLIFGSRGTITGPAEKDVQSSVQIVRGDAAATISKLLSVYHGTQSIIDMTKK